MKRFLKKQGGFTLIELLVVIVILGILMAVALPTYLRQQSKAKDSGAKQYLNYAWKAARTAEVENNGSYDSDLTTLRSDIHSSEPELSFVKASTLTSAISCTWTKTKAGTSNVPPVVVLVRSREKAGGKTKTYLVNRSASGNIYEVVSGTATTTMGINTTDSPYFSVVKANCP